VALTRTGIYRLNPKLSEWMMGLPDGWVTDVPGLSRTAQLRIIGNGVVPLQGAVAFIMLAGQKASADDRFERA
jgi:DNA (cytosine-5)-methyltransferase 1